MRVSTPIFGISGGAVIHLYHALPDYPDPSRAYASRAGGGSRRRWLRPGHRQGGRLYRHLWPWCDQPGHRSGDGLHGLVAGGGHHRAGRARLVIGTDAFQEVDITGITLPITKHNYLVTDVEDLPDGDQGGLPHRPHGPARARCSSTSPRMSRPPSSTMPTPTTCTCRAIACPMRTCPPRSSEMAQMIDEAEETADHRRAWCDPGRCRGCAAGSWSRRRNVPVDHHPAGHRRHAGDPSALPGHGRDARRGLHQPGAMREADLIISLGSRFDDRLTGQSSQFGTSRRASSTSTSTRSRSARTWPADLARRGRSEGCAASACPAGRKRSDRAASGWQRIQEWRDDSAKRDILGQETDELVPQYVVRQTLGGDPGRGRRGLRCRAEPDVGGAVLYPSPAGGACSPPAVWGRWALPCRRPSAPRWACPMSRCGSPWAMVASR